MAKKNKEFTITINVTEKNIERIISGNPTKSEVIGILEIVKLELVNNIEK